MSSKKRKSIKSLVNPKNKTTNHREQATEKPNDTPVFTSLPNNTNQPNDFVKDRREKTTLKGSYIQRRTWNQPTPNEKRPLGQKTIKELDDTAQNSEKRPLNKLDTKEPPLEQTLPSHTVEIEPANFQGIKKYPEPPKKDAEETLQTSAQSQNSQKTKILEETLLSEPAPTALIDAGKEKTSQLPSGKEKTSQLPSGKEKTKHMFEGLPQTRLTSGNTPPLLEDKPKTTAETQDQNKETAGAKTQKNSKSETKTNDDSQKAQTASTNNTSVIAFETTVNTPDETEANPVEDQDKLTTASTKSEKLGRKATLYLVLFVSAWTVLAVFASQFITSFAMQLFLGSKIQLPFWTAVTNALTYLLAVTLIVTIPPKIAKTARKTQRTRQTELAKHSDSQAAKPEAKKSQKNQPSIITNLALRSDSEKIHYTEELDQTEDEITTSLSNNLKTNRKELGLLGAPTFVDIGLAPIGYAIYLALAAIFSQLMSMLFQWFNNNEAQDVGFTTSLEGFDRIIAVISLVFIAPIAEEIIFRGWLYGKLRNRIKLPLAIIITSLLFAILHGQWNVGVSVFALSLVLCGLREVTGTIWSGMILHMLSNGIAFYLLYIAII